MIIEQLNFLPFPPQKLNKRTKNERKNSIPLQSQRFNTNDKENNSNMMKLFKKVKIKDFEKLLMHDE